MRMVNDLAGILGSETSSLEAKLRAYNDSTSTQIVVVTVDSLNGYDVADFSYRLATSWGIGQKDKDNGLLILVAPNERKMRIEVGYGLEAFVPDAKSKWIINTIMKPSFKEGNYAEGINNAVDAIIDETSDAYTRDGSETDTAEEEDSWVGWFFIMLIVLYFIFNRKSGSATRYTSGGWFGGGGWFDGGSSGGDFGGGDFGGGGASGDW